MEKHSVSRMIGAPPGYVGYDEGGALTEAVRRRPYQVVLFDEVEKAHPDVFNVLLQVLDDGRLTDGQGRTVDFRNTLLIMTSNLGSAFLGRARPMAMMWRRCGARSWTLLRRHFRPEFLNRVDEIILFKRLGRSEMDNIVGIQLQRVEKMLADRRMAISLDPAARHWLAERGYDPVYGARPLKRVIQKELVDPLREEASGRRPDGRIGDRGVSRRSWPGNRQGPGHLGMKRGRAGPALMCKSSTRTMPPPRTSTRFMMAMSVPLPPRGFATGMTNQAPFGQVDEKRSAPSQVERRMKAE